MKTQAEYERARTRIYIQYDKDYIRLQNELESLLTEFQNSLSLLEEEAIQNDISEI